MTTEPSSTTSPRSSSRRGKKILWTLLVFVLLVLVSLPLMLWAGLHTERGTAWLLLHLPNVKAQGVRGPLLGDFSVQNLRIKMGAHGDTLTLENLRWKDFNVGWSSAKNVWLELRPQGVHVRRMALDIKPRPPNQPEKPKVEITDLHLPIELASNAVRVDLFEITTLKKWPVRNIEADLHLSARGGQEHRIGRLQFEMMQAKWQGNAVVQTAAPLQVQAQLQGQGEMQPVAAAAQANPLFWRGTAQLQGPLAQLNLRTRIDSVGATAASTPSAGIPPLLDAQAQVHPFKSMVIEKLQAQVHDLNLADFAPQLPRTALRGSARVGSQGLQSPAQVTLDINNLRAGPWSEQALPVRQVQARLQGVPNQLDRLQLQQLTAELGTAKQPAGRIEAQGEWAAGKTWQVRARLQDVQPQVLDARAPAMRLSGEADVSQPSLNLLTLRTDLQGQLTGKGVPNHPVKVQLQGQASPDLFQVETLRLLAGPSSLEGKGQFARVSVAIAPAGWRLQTDAQLRRFDPGVWLPSLQPRGKGRAADLNADLKVDLQLPGTRSLADWMKELQQTPLIAVNALQGQATVNLQRSQWAGIPLQGELLASNPKGNALQISGQLEAGPNKMRWASDGLKVASTKGASPLEALSWDVSIDAPDLRPLRPLWQLLRPAGSESEVLQGQMQGKARWKGQWPQVSTQGSLTVRDFKAGPYGLKDAQAQWRLNMQAPLQSAEPLELQAKMNALEWGEQKVDVAEARLTGSLKQHQLEVRAQTSRQVPAWLQTMQGAQGTPDAEAVPQNSAQASKQKATLLAQGGFTALGGAAADSPTRWQGTVRQLELRPDVIRPNQPLWLQTENVQLQAQWGGPTGGGLQRFQAQPAQARILGAELKWTQLDWQAAQGNRAAQLNVLADLSPMQIAPLLARFQPEFGWGGDLKVKGSIQVKSAPTISADIVLERVSGDLTVTESGISQELGITDMRLGLVAQNGTWSFTQAFAGTSVGVATGAQTVRTRPTALWPQQSDPLQGVLELRATNLNAWGMWVPAGWRLGGMLHVAATIGGRFGAPEYTGQVTGKNISARNLLEGVNVTEGDLDIQLQGATARINHFTAKGGNGTVKLQGQASFGESPQALLDLKAERFQLLGRVDRRIVASGTGQLKLEKSRLDLTGQFKVDEGLIDFSRGNAPTLSNDVRVVRGATTRARTPNPAEGQGPPAPTPPPRTTVAMDVKVDLGNNLRLKGRGIDTGLQGELQMTAPKGRLNVNGTVRTAGGTYQAYGQKLEIDKGLVIFSGPVDNPRLDIEATRPKLEIRVGVAITGSAAAPRIRLFSDEAGMSDDEKLSWLVLGRSSEELGREETALLQTAALALLSGEGPGVTDQLFKALGVDDLSVRQSDDGDARETVISLGKQISKNWYVGYERGLNTTTGTWQLIYRLAQRFTLRAQSGDQNSVELVWTWKWR
jgi:translocation and assembly module TamB